MEFFEALKDVDEKSAYMSPAERLAQLSPLDPRVRANKAVAEMGAPFLDRGLAKWEAPNRVEGFLWFFAWLEGDTGAPWRAHARQEAKRILDWRVANPGKDMEELALQIALERRLRRGHRVIGLLLILTSHNDPRFGNFYAPQQLPRKSLLHARVAQGLCQAPEVLILRRPKIASD